MLPHSRVPQFLNIKSNIPICLCSFCHFNSSFHTILAAKMGKYSHCTEVTPECPVEATIYGYKPNPVVNLICVIVFGVLFFVAVWQTYKHKTYSFGVAMSLGCVAEAIGYGGRLVLNRNPWDSNGFQIQICTLIIAPSFFTAAIYLTLKHLCFALGPHLSIIKPSLYTWIFISFDVLSLSLQGAGGALAATGDTEPDKNRGAQIMLSGIVWQVVTLIIFGGMAGHFFWRLLGDDGRRMSIESQKVWANTKFRRFLISLGISFFVIFVRCTYRIAEMAGGWSNHIMQDEISFVILEGVMCIIAAILLTTFHPGTHFPQMRTDYQKDNTDRFSMVPPQQTETSYVAVDRQPLIDNQRPETEDQGRLWPAVIVPPVP
ncbi:parasitic phase-specific protein PSP-1 [Histoplasma capsulatum G186AR]|uniref:Parasitic phase-specific protein PSP-1 n=1 Tax=Ajellomyces capsulatus TaxID=5037 RepID=A0A8H7YKQ8_AJECA|nr:parasitic phase-specific protein PSP-1 [Histoplasma capsulatum]QSS68541.1 parasitic phase-specific protein PSP-1 [Histoplasma capsulatum G186AR]